MDCNTTQAMLQIATDRLDYYVYLTIASMFLSAIAIIASIYYNRKQLEKSSELHEKQLKKSSELHEKQLKANHDLNRRSFTSAQLKDFIKQLSAIRDELDRLTTPIKTKECIDGKDIEVIQNEIIENEGKFINFTDRLLLPNKPLTADEVHKWVCKEDASHPSGYEKTAKGDNKPCKTTKNGELIVNNLLEFISIYEQIAVGLLNKVFDEKIISDTLKHPIKHNYKFYKDYIQHRRDNHDDKNFAESFKQMYIKFWGEKLTGDGRKNTED